MRYDYPVIVLGNRGYRKLYGENTLLSFKKALEYGADGVNFSVWKAKDGSVIINHDNKIEDNNGNVNLINELDYKKIKKIKLPLNQRIPTLEMLLKDFPEENLINIIINEKELLETIIHLVNSLNFSPKILYSSKDENILIKLKELDEDLFLAYYISKKEQIERAFELNKKINLYSININMDSINFYGIDNFKNFASRVREENIKIFINNFNDVDLIDEIKGYFDVLETDYIEEVIDKLQKIY